MTWQRIFRYVTKNKQQTKKHNLHFIKSKCFCFKRYHKNVKRQPHRKYLQNYNSVGKSQLDAGSSNQVLCDNLEGREMGGRFKREGTYVYLWLIHVDE